MAFGNATKGYIKAHSGGGGGGGTSNYNDLSNKPSINGVTLSGDKTSDDLGIMGGGIDFSNMELIASNPTSQTLTINNCNGVVIEFCYHYSDGDNDCDFFIAPLQFFDVVGVGKRFTHEFKPNTNYFRLNVDSISNGVYTFTFQGTFESGGRFKIYKF